MIVSIKIRKKDMSVKNILKTNQSQYRLIVTYTILTLFYCLEFLINNYSFSIEISYLGILLSKYFLNSFTDIHISSSTISK